MKNVFEIYKYIYQYVLFCHFLYIDIKNRFIYFFDYLFHYMINVKCLFKYLYMTIITKML